MAKADIECLRIAEPQLGLITLEQTRAAGLSQDQVDDRVRERRWRRPHVGVYAIGGLPLTWEQQAMAGSLYARGPASHQTAAVLWNLSGVEKGPIEVITTHKLRARDLIHHRRTHLPQWTSRKEGIPVTDPTETLLDLASVCRVGRLEVALDSALRMKLSHLELLRTRLEGRAIQGRNGIRIMRAILETRDPSYAISQSDLESMFLRFVSRFNLPRPSPQVRIRDEEWGFVGRPDFVYPKERIVIELQSYRHHGDREAWEKDQARFGDFSALDWMLITVTYLQLKLEPDRVAERIRRVLRARARLAAG